MEYAVDIVDSSNQSGLSSLEIVHPIIKNDRQNILTKQIAILNFSLDILDNISNNANAAMIDRKKYMNTNQRDGMIFRKPNKGNPKVMTKSSIMQMLMGKVKEFLYFFEAQNKKPMAAKNNNIANPAVSATRSRREGRCCA